MRNEKPRKSHVGALLTLLLFVIVVALLLDFSPFYYKRLFNIGSSSQSTSQANSLSVQREYNAELRAAMENGGDITFEYNYIPSERSWHSMYSYCLYRYGTSGDFTFYCDGPSAKSGEPLCSCLFAKSVWDDLLDLILDNGELADCTSIYDSNGKVVSTPIAKTVSLSAGSVYSPSNINEIEDYFKRLAIIAGADSADLEWNIPIDDVHIADKTTVDLRGAFFNDFNTLVYEIPDYDIAPEVESYLRQKYEETGVRMYVLLFDSDDIEALRKKADEMLELATSPAMAFGLTASRTEYVFRYKIDPNQESKLRDEYSVVPYAYYSGGLNLFGKLISAIDMAYQLY